MEAALPHLWALRGLRGCYLPSKTKNGFLGCASPLCWDCSGVMMKDICSTEQKKLKTVAILLVCFCVCVCVCLSICLCCRDFGDGVRSGVGLGTLRRFMGDNFTPPPLLLTKMLSLDAFAIIYMRESYFRLFPPHCPAISRHLPENSIFCQLPPFAPLFG